MGKTELIGERELAWYALASGPFLSVNEKAIFHRTYPDVMEWWRDGGRQIEETDGIDKRIKKRFALNDFLREEKVRGYEVLTREGIRFLSIEHPEYPVRLSNIPDPPVGIFFAGKLPDEFTPSVAVVGARECSYYGRAAAGAIGRVLGEAGIPVISGLAYGIDGAAQQACVNAGCPSYAVMAGGTDRCYPREQIHLFEAIKRCGGIISEMPPRTVPHPYLFPIRNRIISGLSDVVVIVEARVKSGSLITADLAIEQGKEVFAIPGRMYDELSEGCNRLIRQGAQILTEPEELLEYLGRAPKMKAGLESTPGTSDGPGNVLWAVDAQGNVSGTKSKHGNAPGTPEGQGRTRKGVEGRAARSQEEERQNPQSLAVLRHLDDTPQYLEDLAQALSMPMKELSQILLNLELQGKIEQPFANYYVKIR